MRWRELKDDDDNINLKGIVRRTGSKQNPERNNRTERNTDIDYAPWGHTNPRVVADGLYLGRLGNSCVTASE